MGSRSAQLHQNNATYRLSEDVFIKFSFALKVSNLIGRLTNVKQSVAFLITESISFVTLHILPVSFFIPCFIYLLLPKHLQSFVFLYTQHVSVPYKNVSISQNVYNLTSHCIFMNVRCRRYIYLHFPWQLCLLR